ncbi:MAG TPA: TA system VapC family ribonuclease toxin [Terracidiphilus sp.]|nr:TA system VapC family ribonuclease toxin [Terracidiphilus sp.]
MIRFLLDVNVLIALIDSTHVQHDRAHDWFGKQGKLGWATCPMTENGVIRIVGSNRYPNTPGSPAAVLEILAVLRSLGGHEFWADDISLLDQKRVNASRLLDSAQVTDTYLLALAASHRGQLATFDKHLVSVAVAGGSRALFVIS